MRTTTLLSLLILSCVSFSSCTITYWPVGGLSYGSFGPNYTSADDPFYLAQFMHFAVLYINNYSNLLPANVKFQMTYYNTQGDNTQGVIDAFQLADISHVRGVAGGTFSSEVVAEATVLQYFKVPQNSGTASYGGLSDKTQYPYFFRVSYADYGQSIAVLALLKSFGYTEVVVLYSVDDYGIGCRTAFVEYAANYSITPTAISIPASASASADFASVLSQVKATKINVFVVFCQVVQGTPMIIEANTTGLIGSKYVWIVCDTLTYQYQTPSSSNPDPSILDGMLGIEEPSGYGPLFDEVWQIYNTLDPNVWWGAGSYVDPGYPSWYTFDSMYVFAVGLAKLLNDGVPIQNITNDLYTTTLFGVNFTGTTGDIAFDANGDRQGAYLIYNWHNKGNNLTNTMYIDANMTYSILAPTYFYGETTTIPPDTDPVCSCLNGGVCSDLGNADNKCICPSGYSGTNCETFTNNNSADVKKIVIAVVIPVVGVMAIVLAAAYSYYRKKRTHLIKSVAEKQKSELPRNDILLGERIGRGASGEVFRGQLRGTDVAIKKFIINGVSNDALDQFTLESSMMCGLRHPNVVLFMGSCCDLKTKEMLLVMEFMNRGSLYDVIHNKKVFLSYELKLHLALQTAQGINFLHQSSPAILHRDIKSHNILLDDKWTARISDFGITIPSTKGGDDHNVGTIYWTAVEVLNGQRYTEKSDCYSFGIVLYELFHSSDPYPGRDAMVVASQVISSGLRPTIDPSKVPYEVRSLMESCWASDPELRPTFKEVVARLKQLTTEHPMLPNSLMQDNVSAPTGTVFLVKTMVENALNMWDSTPRAMAFAMILHNDMLRKSLAKFNGYESSFDDNNSFLVSFADLDSAVKWCLDVQNALANASWPATLKGKGLRVRMALNTGAPNCHITQNAGNIHYFGPVVEKLSKILDAGRNGEILASESVVALLHTRDFGVQVSPFKAYYEILSNSMLKPMPEDVNLGRVTSYDEALTTPGSTPRANRTPNWVVDLADVSIKTLMGVGPLGECSKVALNNNELVMKMLGYQKLTENDVFMFICYGSILSKLRHQNIAAYYGICIQPKSRSIFQEFMERGSLQSILRNPSIDLPSERKLQFAIDIASGMHYLSLVDDEDISKNRNLKSCNCMVGKNWEVKVADFGLHKVKDVMQTITASVNVAWTAPEQFENDTNVFNHASPVYSFGIILWEILTRKVPFAGVHPTRLVSLTLSGLRPEIPNSCPHPYQNLMERCWDAQPNKRPTWQEILNELHNMREYSKINIA